MQLHASREYKRTPFKFIILLCNIMNMYNIYLLGRNSYQIDMYDYGLFLIIPLRMQGL